VQLEEAKPVLTVKAVAVFPLGSLEYYRKDTLHLSLEVFVFAGCSLDSLDSIFVDAGPLLHLSYD
jgi:hypothetical protein